MELDGICLEIKLREKIGAGYDRGFPTNAFPW